MVGQSNKLFTKVHTAGAIDSEKFVSSKLIATFISTDDTDKLSEDLQNDQLVRSELSNLAGLLVLTGDRFVALASALFHVVRHVRIGQDPPNAPILHLIFLIFQNISHNLPHEFELVHVFKFLDSSETLRQSATIAGLSAQS